MFLAVIFAFRFTLVITQIGFVCFNSKQDLGWLIVCPFSFCWLTPALKVWPVPLCGLCLVGSSPQADGLWTAPPRTSPTNQLTPASPLQTAKSTRKTGSKIWHNIFFKGCQPLLYDFSAYLNTLKPSFPVSFNFYFIKLVFKKISLSA